MKFDLKTSQRICKLREIVPKECYTNSLRTIIHLDEFKGATYVEGWWCSPIAIEHAWLEHKGKIVDPTAWQVQVMYGKLGGKDLFEIGKYFPVVKLEGRWGIARHQEKHLDDPYPPYFYHFPERHRTVWKRAYKATWGAFPEEVRANLKMAAKALEAKREPQ